MQTLEPPSTRAHRPLTTSASRARCASLALCASIALAACVSEVDLVSPDLPAGTRAVMFVLESGGEHQVIGVPVDADGHVDWPALAITRTTSYTLWALAYGCTLQDLGYQEGANRVVEPGSTVEGLRLEPPVKLAKAQVSGLAVGRWEAVDGALPSTLDAVRIGEAVDLCAKQPTPAPLDLTYDFPISALAAPNSLFTVLRAADTALVGARRNDDDGRTAVRVWEVGGTSLRASSLPLDVPDLAAFYAGEGELWFLGATGRVLRGSLSSRPLELGRLPAVGTSTAWAGAIDGVGGAAPDVFAILTDGLVRHFDGASWATLPYDGAAPLVRLLPCALSSQRCVQLVQLVRTGPNRASWMIAHDGEDEALELQLYSWDGQRVVREALVAGPPRVLAWLPGYGRAVGTATGELVVTDASGRTAPLRGSQLLPRGREVTAIAPLGEGWVAGFEDGSTQLFVPGLTPAEDRVCALRSDLVRPIDALVPLADGGLVALERVDILSPGVHVEGFQVAGLKTRRTPASCSGD